MASITNVYAREILDSRANPTIETTIVLDTGHVSVASVPSGASVGKNESLELRDNDPHRFHGMGVIKAVNFVNKVIGPGLRGVDPVRQNEIDRWLIQVDGTHDLSKFGGNTLLSISFALARAGSIVAGTPLYQYLNSLYTTQTKQEIPITTTPTPIFNVINGGKHGAGNLDFQEFHIIPSSGHSFAESIRIGSELYHTVRQVLIDKNAIHSVGDEGGYAPNLYTNLDALEILMNAVTASPYRFGENVFIGLDVAASHFHNKDHYTIRDKQQAMSPAKFIEYLIDLNEQYHLLMLEDPLTSDDWKGWKSLNGKIGKDVIIVGDDLLATNKTRLKKAIDEKACSAILLKPNQVGTLTEVFETVKVARKNEIKIITSHRSGETTDDFIADLSIAIQSEYVKFGAPARGERVVKYNRILQIEPYIQTQ